MSLIDSNITRNCSKLKCSEVLGWHVEPKASIIFRLSVFSFVILCSIVGNSIVVKAIRERPHLRKPFPYFVVTSLAVAELVGTICLPFFQVYDELMTWPFGDTMCRLINAFMLTSYFVIPWSLATIAFLRLRTFSQRRIFMLSGKRIICFISLMWFCGCLVSAPTYIFALEVKSIYDNHSYWCIELLPGDSLQSFPSLPLKRYYFVRFLLNFVLPGLFIVITYGGVAMKLKRHLIASSQQRHSDVVGENEPHTMSTINNTSTSESLGNVVESAPSEAENPAADTSRQDARITGDQLKEIENDLLRMIYIIILIYVGCYIPYQAFFLMEYFESTFLMTWRYFAIARRYAYLLTCFPSALHPVCYGTMSKFYAQVFSRLILCKKPRI